MSKPTVQEAPAIQETPTGPTAILDPAPAVRTKSRRVPAKTAGILPQPSVNPSRKLRTTVPAAGSVHPFSAFVSEEDLGNRQAELFYLQKQIQLQTQMIFILEDGERVQGIIEWYDRHSIKIRGRSRVLIYKAAIKYLYKAGEVGSSPEK